VAIPLGHALLGEAAVAPDRPDGRVVARHQPRAARPVERLAGTPEPCFRRRAAAAALADAPAGNAGAHRQRSRHAARAVLGHGARLGGLRGAP
jgi:hypothetical protein